MVYLMFFSFNSQVWLLNSVLLLDLAFCFGLCLIDDVWTASLAFQSVDARPVYVSTWPLSTWVTVAWYIVFVRRHCPPSGQDTESLTALGQLHFLASSGASGCCCLISWWLCQETIWAMLGMVRYEIFTVCLLISFRSGWPGGKQSSILFKNRAPTLVATFWDQGGLKYVVSLLFVLRLCVVYSFMYFNVCLYPALFKAAW